MKLMRLLARVDKAPAVKPSVSVALVARSAHLVQLACLNTISALVCVNIAVISHKTRITQHNLAALLTVNMSVWKGSN